MLIEKKEYGYFIIGFILLLLTCFLHFWKIGEIPNGFYADECAVGYNAYCIAKTGADEYGTQYPLFFRSFDNYNDPLMIYMLVPLVEMFGLEKWVVRFPSALFHIVASLAFGYAIYRFTRRRWLSLVGAFIFSVLPWCFPVSRSAMAGYTLSLTGIVFAWIFMYECIVHKSYFKGFLAASAWAFSIYGHISGRMVSVIIISCFVIAFNRLLFKRIRYFLFFICALSVYLIPLAVAYMRDPVVLTGRASQVISSWKKGYSFFDNMANLLSQYCEYFSPYFLFVRGDKNLRHNAGCSGELYYFMLPLILAGLYVLLRYCKRNANFRFILLCLISYQLVASFTKDHMHSTRSMPGAIFWCMTAVIGYDYIFYLCRKSFSLKFFQVILLSVAILETGHYVYFYFNKYVSISRNDSGAPTTELFEYSFSQLKPGETLYVSSSVFTGIQVDLQFKRFMYITILFLGKIDPHTYQKDGIPSDYVCPYNGKIERKGLLIRSDHVLFVPDKGKRFFIKNNELIPENAELLNKTPSYMNQNFEVYRIK